MKFCNNFGEELDKIIMEAENNHNALKLMEIRDNTTKISDRMNKYQSKNNKS
jgi:hypothetical protein